MPKLIVIYGIVSLVSAVLAMLVAKFKGRSADRWGFSSFLLPPALLVLLLLPKNNASAEQRPLTQKEIRDIKSSMWD